MGNASHQPVPPRPDTSHIRARFNPLIVPEALRNRRRWVVWKYEWDGKKWRKVPYRVGRKGRASTKNSSTWSTFEEAVKAWLASGDWDGIEYVFTAEDEFCGIDLDDCIDEMGNIAPEARAIIDEFASYSEISPSGRGVKIFIIGRKLVAECRSTAVAGFGEVEIYDQGRFFVVTGMHVEGRPLTIESRQLQLDALCAKLWPLVPAPRRVAPRAPVALGLDDDEILEKLRSWKNGAAFARLHSGDSSDYGNDASRGDLAYCGMLAFATGGSADQIDGIVRNSGRMRPKWDEFRGKTKYGERTIAKALRGRTEFYTPSKRGKMSSKPSNGARGALQREKLCSDIGNAARLVAQHGKNIRFCHPTDTWFVWRGTHWKADDCGRIVDLCKKSALSLLDEAKRADDRERDELLKWARQSQKRDRLNAMAELAKPDVAVTPADLDRDGFLFNCLNGTLDLRTGILRPNDPGDLITQIAPVKYDPEAKCPRFDQFLEETFCGDVEVIQFVDRWLGHCLTGDVREQYFMIGVGGGNNGKNVMCDTISMVMGPYACEAPPTLLTIRKHAEHPTEIADLMGKRLVIASETEKNEELRLQLIKRLTGNAKLKGRFVRQDYVEFKRTHKLMLLTNNVPRISEDSVAVWRRILVLPFDNQVGPTDDDKQLLQKLERECAGILARLVRGCLAWQKHGLAIPDSVKFATQKLRGDSNSFLSFLRERCEFNSRACVVTAELREAYSEFCIERNVCQVDAKSIADALRDHGCIDKKHKSKWHWFGVALTQSTGHDGHPGRGLTVNPQSLSFKEVNGRTTSSMSSMSADPTSQGQEA